MNVQAVGRVMDRTDRRMGAMFRAQLVAVVCTVLCASAAAQPETTPAHGSASFCLFRLPADESGRQRLINLAIVQYVEIGRNELKIAYGGGNFGAGHEARIPVAGDEEAQAQLDRMRQAAAACR